MTDLTSEKDRLKFFFPDGCGLLKTPCANREPVS